MPFIRRNDLYTRVIKNKKIAWLIIERSQSLLQSYKPPPGNLNVNKAQTSQPQRRWITTAHELEAAIRLLPLSHSS